MTDSASRERSTARAILSLLLEGSKPTSVAEIGCRSAEWVNACVDLGIGEVHAFVSHDRGIAAHPGIVSSTIDLENPPQQARIYDVALCLEVAQDLGEDRADSFVQYLTGLAPAVLFSSAVPNQGGVRHRNGRWPDQWAPLFAKSGFSGIDCIRRTFWERDDMSACYLQNAILYVKDERHWQHVASLPSFSMVPVVHPGVFAGIATELHSLRPLYTARALVKRLPSAIWGSLMTPRRQKVD